MPVAIVFIVMLFVFGIGGFAIWTEHVQKMARLQGTSKAGANRELLDAFESLRQQVVELRDTTTKYDMSFDAALQRLESRVEHLEAQQRQAEPVVMARNGQ